ncbi:hypothetical protein FNF07_04385 [Trinickia caryophylli]|nr:hypothetical protein C0Z17_14470 [Trinickia caryophylli]TRX17540.1 hypothetical protein FNF07_04385 [Trinickia caryophylli]
MAIAVTRRSIRRAKIVGARRASSDGEQACPPVRRLRSIPRSRHRLAVWPRRLHSTLNYVSPMTFEKNWAAAQRGQAA